MYWCFARNWTPCPNLSRHSYLSNHSPPPWTGTAFYVVWRSNEPRRPGAAKTLDDAVSHFLNSRDCRLLEFDFCQEGGYHPSDKNRFICWSPYDHHPPDNPPSHCL